MAEVSMLTRVNSYLRTKLPNPVISYKNLRTLIGILGMLLPVVCYFGGRWFAGLPLQRSISFYYHTNVRDAFVGLLVAVGMFMVTYRGYENIDNIVSHVIGAAALGIAIFPCLDAADPAKLVGFFQIAPKASNTIHVSSAATFFFLLAINSIFIFTLSDKPKDQMGDKKKIRNKIYVACGVIILLCMATLIAIEFTIPEAVIDSLGIVFWVEAVMLNAFGISWLVKGEAIFAD